MSTSRKISSLHSPAYRRFRQRLKLAREEAQLSQEQVAKKLRKPQSYVAKSELGERRVDVIELAAFAKLYRKPLDWFIIKKK